MKNGGAPCTTKEDLINQAFLWRNLCELWQCSRFVDGGCQAKRPWITERGALNRYIGFSETDSEDSNMLVLTRRTGESIMIDNEIELKVLKIRGSQVHIGIEAPKSAAVHRKEVWLRIHGEPKPAGRIVG